MLLAAWADGIASCPNGITDADSARAALDAAEDEVPVIVLSFGLPERERDPESLTADEWSERGDWSTVEAHRGAIREARPDLEPVYDVLAELTAR